VAIVRQDGQAQADIQFPGCRAAFGFSETVSRRVTGAGKAAYDVIHIEPGLYLRIQQLPDRAHPLPLSNGFSSHIAYRAVGVYSPSETSECYFIVCNDRDEMWFISNRHFRSVGLHPSRQEMRIPLAELQHRSEQSESATILPFTPSTGDQHA
jgi:hypothetical protein